MNSRLQPGAQIASRWQVNQLIGAGALGEVYEVVESANGRVYALKLFTPELAKAAALWADYQALARRASSLPFDTIAKLYDFGGDQALGGAPFSVGERVLWPSLDQLVKQRGPLPVERVAVLLELLAPALDAAHAAGVVHRGLSPSNVFAAKEGGGVRVSDFGAALLRRAVTVAPGWAGPPGYIGPDAVDHTAPANPRMDVYALGALVFFALTGFSPFKAMQARPIDFGVLWNELILPLPPASQRARELGASLPAELDPWFVQTLSPHPKARFASISEATHAFAQRAAARVREVSGVTGTSGIAPAGTVKGGPLHTMMGGFGVGMPAAPEERSAAVVPAPKRTMMGMPKLPGSAVPAPAVPAPTPRATTPLGLGTPVAASPAEPKRSFSGTLVMEDAKTAARAAGPGVSPTAQTEPVDLLLQVSPAPGPAAAASQVRNDPAAPLLGTATSYRPPAPSVSDSGPVALVSARPLAYMPDLPRPAPAAAAPQVVPAPARANERPPSEPAAPQRGGLVLPLLLGGTALVLAVGVAGAWFAIRYSRTAQREAAPPSPESSATAAEPLPPEPASAGPAISAPTAVASASEAPPASAAPSASAAPVARDALVKFQCQPGCDNIACDGSTVESLANGVRLSAGEHQCRATKTGFIDRTDTIPVKAGVDQTHVFRLRPEPAPQKPAEARPERPRPTEPRPPAAATKPSGGGEKKKKPCGTFINPCK